MTDVRAFHDYQSRTAFMTDREHSLEVRRIAVQELRQRIMREQQESQLRQEQLDQERARYSQKKNVQDEKLRAKEAHAKSQHDHVNNLAEEEERLTASIKQCSEAIEKASSDIEQRKRLEANLREAKDALTRLKYDLEEKDAQVMKMEAKVARIEMTTEKRHNQFAERLPDQWLPRVVEPNHAAGLEGTAGESILLVDDEVAV
ncbi:hypothetical protein AGDE_04508 [Angomonas deanei]|uniref:Uncharacterized protein n=1 Tax=Angomonas deanei TaxID=59799 RepID=A0A7G2CJ22_9TRYP|nr:hypothetical protein AGDE_04508 [Angomonas deanei]CAD2219848.1 hypothetical protein, conserved [Angomonas deanei]|eukprot:EPY39420.1 hypothetical protein AGDE_04508 [Angomonas deanei]